jgi:GAF domain-containing protein
LRGKERPARRSTKPAKAKVEAKRSIVRKSRKSEGARVHDLEKRLAEALGQRAALSEILQVISETSTDVQPVFDTIATNALRLCTASYCAVFRFDGELIHVTALQNVNREGADSVRAAYPAPPSRGNATARAILTRAVVDIPDVCEDSEYELQEMAAAVGFRSVLAVPMLREGNPIGAISVTAPDVAAFSDNQVGLLRTFANQAVIAIENVRLFNETKEALERQTATAEILRVISSSPTDLQPVLDTVVKSAARFCGAYDAELFRLDAGLKLAAHHGPLRVPSGLLIPVVRGTVGGRSVLERRAVHAADVQAEAEEFPEGSAFAREFGHHTTLAVPLLRDGEAIGTIQLRRLEVNPFTDKQIALLQTFADQAVIAIENVRLFSELNDKNQALTEAHAQVTEAFDRQTATSEILGVISRSLTEVEPVFDTVVSSAARLCEAHDVALLLIEGDHLRLAAGVGPLYMSIPSDFRIRLTRGSAATRAVIDRATVHIHDFAAEPDEEYPVGRELARRFGHRTMLAVPLLRETTPIGVICAFRLEVRPFPEQQIALLRTFAAQAVIAIENVRLFTELQEKNTAVTRAHAQVSEALEQQTATSEILKVISSSPTDVQPVFDAIVRNAVRICGGFNGTVFRFDGRLIHVAAHHNLAPEAAEVVHQVFPIPADSGSVTGRAILMRSVIHVPDVVRDPEHTRTTLLNAGFRAILSVPMLHDGEPIGAITVTRRQPEPFSVGEIKLFQTFADQAIIAVENVRLFTELQEKNHALTEAHTQVTESLERQTATSETLQVISQSPTDVQPVFDAIVRSGAALCHASDVIILMADGDSLRIAASVGSVASSVRHSQILQGGALPLTRGSVSGRAFIDGRTVHVRDVSAMPDDEFPEGKKLQSEYGGHGTTLAVPLLREQRSLGVITLVRNEVSPFTDRQVALLQTFANQAVIAIENVRLFNETKEALERQTATSEILRVISRNPTDIRPVLETIVEHAGRVCGAFDATVFLVEGDRLARAAHRGPVPLTEGSRSLSIDRDSVSGVAVLNCRTVYVEDMLAAREFPRGRAFAEQSGFRTIVCVPLAKEGAAIGTLVVRRTEVQAFTAEQIALLETFADQAVIALENVRLFSELRERTGELTRSVEKLTALGEVSQAVSSTLDLDTVLETITERARQLAGADGGAIYEYDESTREFHLRATRNVDLTLIQALRSVPFRKGEGLMGRATEAREPTQLADIAAPGVYESHFRDELIRAGYRALLSVPLVRESQIIGSLSLNRKAPGLFPPEVVDVLRTFATQSALAIQNARLFRELAEKSRQVEAASQHKSEFLANMSHELRTPLNAVIGFSEVLGERMFGELNEKQDEYLKDIHASGQHLLSLINDILDLSKIEAGRMELEVADFHLPQAISNALVLVRERALRRGITLEQAIDSRLGEIRGDERKIKQVLLNLLSNAIKFTPDGGRINVRAMPRDTLVELSVSDTGVGIEPADQEAIFEEFRQVGTAAKKVEGTGLGLTLSRKFIELHGGRIWVESDVGVGSTFTFTIPTSIGA